MSATLPQVLRDNMDKWTYDDDGKMVPTKGATFRVIQAIEEMNQMEEQSESDDFIIDD